MDKESVDKRAHDLKSKVEKLKQPPIGMRLDVLVSLADAISSNQTLKRICGEPVLEHLIIISDVNDLRIAPLKAHLLSEEEKMAFSQEINDVFDTVLLPGQDKDL